MSPELNTGHVAAAGNHQRDDHADVRVACHQDASGIVGPVGAAVERGVDP